MEKIILIGLGGHAKSVVDSIEKSNNYKIMGFLDVEEKLGQGYRNYKVIGTDQDLETLFKQGIMNAFVAIGYMGSGCIRNNIYEKLKEIGFNIPVIIDNSAQIAADSKIEEGTFVGKQAVVNANAYIGKMAVINTAAIIEHDAVIGDFSHIAVGAVLCGGATIGSMTLIGARAAILQNIEVGRTCIIGAGSVVVNNVEDNTTVMGIPARVE